MSSQCCGTVGCWDSRSHGGWGPGLRSGGTSAGRRRGSLLVFGHTNKHILACKFLPLEGRLFPGSAVEGRGRRRGSRSPLVQGPAHRYCSTGRAEVTGLQGMMAFLPYLWLTASLLGGTQPLPVTEACLRAALRRAGGGAGEGRGRG